VGTSKDLKIVLIGLLVKYNIPNKLKKTQAKNFKSLIN